MKLNEDLCYRAIKSRDVRFDGQFFTAVLTTGIYCRPVCPAVTPKRKNVVFYKCAAAAEQAGFRPCRRCHPETAPGTAAWQGTAAVVSRAMRYINEGFLDEAGVEELALHVGLGGRHLRRLFREHLGTTPIAVAQTRRLHFARNLLDTSNLSMTEIAMASGFGSLRRFNTLFKKAFAAPPSQFKKKDKRRGAPSFVYHLPYRQPYDWTALLKFLAPRAIPGVEAVDLVNGVYSRTVELAGKPGVIKVSGPSNNKSHLTLLMELPSLEGAIGVVAKIKRMFDCTACPSEISKQLVSDEFLAPLIKAKPGLRLPGAWDPFELTIRAILGQQISVKAATTHAGNLVKLFGRKLPDELCISGLTHIFPRAMELNSVDLTELGLPKNRLATIAGLVDSVASGAFTLDAPNGADEFAERFLTLFGIGPWTAQYVAMRAFSEPDAFPHSDLGLRHATGLTSKALLAAAEKWRPWRSYAALYLWSSLS